MKQEKKIAEGRKEECFLFMNPGNGIETLELQDKRTLPTGFLFMNPGNGIETFTERLLSYSLGVGFLFMNPGNGIETYKSSGGCLRFDAFLIYESRQRD